MAKDDKIEIALFLWFWYRYCKSCRAFIRIDIDHAHEVYQPDLLDLRDNLNNFIEGAAP